jgi:hypothetical protein
VLDSHRTDDSGPKVGRWPTSVGATVPKRIPHSCNMGGEVAGWLLRRSTLVVARCGGDDAHDEEVK